MIPKLLIAAVLLAHGAIHAGFVSPRPAPAAGGPPWPFTLDSSWLLGSMGWDGTAMHWIGVALTAATIGGFAVAALVALGLLPNALWIGGVTLGAVASIVLLVLFFHPWLVLGLLIHAAVLWAAWIARWEPSA